MSRKVTDSLQDILDAIAAIERFTIGVNFTNFANNQEKIFAVEKAIEIIGEAAKNVPESITKDYPQVPWQQIAGMRDKLAHQYWRTDVAVIWRTIEQDIPLLKEMIHSIVTDLDRNT